MTSSDLDSRIAALGDAAAGVREAMLHVEVGHCDVGQLAGLKQIANMLRGLSDVLKTDVAVRADELRQVDVNDVVDTTLNPDGRANPQEELVEKDRGAVLDNLPGMDEATRSGELSAQYADVVARALGKLAVDVRAEFYRRHPDLDTIAATRSVHVVPVVCDPSGRVVAGGSRCAAGGTATSSTAGEDLHRVGDGVVGIVGPVGSVDRPNVEHSHHC